MKPYQATWFNASQGDRRVLPVVLYESETVTHIKGETQAEGVEQVSVRRPTPQTAQPLGSAQSYLGRFHPFTGHESPQGEQRYSSTLFQTSALDAGEGSASRPGSTLPPRKTRYPLYRRLGGLRAGLDRCGKSRPTGIRSPDRPARRQSLYLLRYPA